MTPALISRSSLTAGPDWRLDCKYLQLVPSYSRRLSKDEEKELRDSACGLTHRSYTDSFLLLLLLCVVVIVIGMTETGGSSTLTWSRPD